MSNGYLHCWVECSLNNTTVGVAPTYVAFQLWFLLDGDVTPPFFPIEFAIDAFIGNISPTLGSPMALFNGISSVRTTGIYKGVSFDQRVIGLAGHGTQIAEHEPSAHYALFRVFTDVPGRAGRGFISYPGLGQQYEVGSGNYYDTLAGTNLSNVGAYLFTPQTVLGVTFTWAFNVNSLNAVLPVTDWFIKLRVLYRYRRRPRRKNAVPFSP